MKRIITILFWLSVAVNVVGQQYAVVDGIRYTISGNEATVIQLEEGLYIGDVTIPSKINVDGNDYDVTSIGNSAFKDCIDLNSITISQGVTSIAYAAFSGCYSLSSVKLPESVVSISTNAFYKCSSITSIDIPRNVTEIGDYAFRGCSNLRYAVIPNGVNVISVGVFQECTNLNQVVLPNGITRIKDWAFHQSGITSMTIPDGVTSLENSTFANCNNLQTITLPESLVSMDEYAIYGCKNLSKIVCSAKNPPSYTGEPFYYYSATLYVPSESIAKYKNDAKWGNFANIECKQTAHLFSVSDSKCVTFSPGNLQYNAMLGTHECADGTIQQGTWRFAEHQYDIIGTNNKNASETYYGWIDLFGWGTSGWNSGANVYQPYSTSTENSDYYPGGGYNNNLVGTYVNADWGMYNAISNGGNQYGIWRTLTQQEWRYLIWGRSNSSIKSAVATVNNVNGLIILPDDWVLPNGVTFKSGSSEEYGQEYYKTINNYTLSDWSKMEANGAIFFPAAGSRNGTYVSGVGDSGGYWSSLSADDGHAYLSDFNSHTVYPVDVTARYKAVSVRLVKEFNYNVLDIPNMSINEDEVIPSINLLDYCKSEATVTYSYSVQSSNNEIISPVLMGDKLGFISYATGTATITLLITTGKTTIEKSFDITINSVYPPQSCELSISSEITNVTCNNGSDGKIEVSVSGGTAPYQYRWNTGRTSNGIYNVTAGTYNVLVSDDKDCILTKIFSVEEPSAIKVLGKFTRPNCNESDGKIELSVSGGTEPYSYEWSMPDGTKQTTKDIENLALGTYNLTVIDGNSCVVNKSASLSENGAPVVKTKSINPSKCNEATGNVEIEISEGTEPYTYEWSDSTEVDNNLIRPKMFSGQYRLLVADSNNCHSILNVKVPLKMSRQPEIALVSYGDTARHNLVVWQKEQTNDIDEYRIYRETEQPGTYEQIGSSAYNEISVFVDSTADFNAHSCRYRLSSANSCVESPLSREYKTIQLQWRKNDNGSVYLWWDSYEGLAFVKYDLYKLSRNGLEKFHELPANKFKYTVDIVEPGTIGYFVAVELIDTIDVNQYLKAEGGPFVIAFSNIAEIESRDVVDEVIENLPLVFSKNKTIFISNAGENNIFVCDMIGKIIAQRQKVDSAEIPVKTAGVYVVIVGDRVFKLRIMN